MLDQYSIKQRERLAELRPDLLPYASEHPHAEDDHSYLLIQVPSPGDLEKVLFLYTADEEVTIAFGVWEQHFPSPSQLDEDDLKEALAEVEKIQNDELIVVSYWRGEEWLGSRVTAPEEPLVIPGFAEEARSAKILSWSGKLSREVPL